MDAEAEFTEYVVARWSRLVRSAALLGCAPAEAEDVAQEALAKVWRAWRRVRKAEDRDAYVYRVLLNCFTDGRRRRWHGEIPSGHLPESAAPDASDHLGLRDAVLASLSALGEDQRTAVVLRYYAHLSEAQMAAALKVPPGTVKSRLSRALSALRVDPVLVEAGGDGRSTAAGRTGDEEE